MTKEPVSPSPAEDTSSRQPVRLWLLFAVHAILGLFFCLWAAVEGSLPIALPDLLVVFVFGIVFAQSSLLGFWAIFSKASWRLRMAGLLAGTTYLQALLDIGTRSGGISWIVVLSTGGMTLVFVLARGLYAHLHYFPQQAPAANQQELRFSIRGLMLFTGVVAVAIIVVKILRETELRRWDYFESSMWSLCFFLIGLAGVWAGLGVVRPLLRSLAVLLVSGVIGAAFAYGVLLGDSKTYLYLILMMVLQAGVLLASLLVVRSCGYRLVRKPEPKLLD